MDKLNPIVELPNYLGKVWGKLAQLNNAIILGQELKENPIQLSEISHNR